MKILTEEETKWKGIDHYYGLKRYFNKPPINDWYEKIYRHPDKIGYVSAMLKKWAPSSPEQAYEMYLESGLKDTENEGRDRGRTKDELETLAIEWKAKSNSSRPLSEFYDALVLHAVVETYFGNCMEEQARTEYERHGFKTNKTDGYDDRTNGIDFIASDGDKTFLVQIKPVAFFFGMKPDLVSDRIMMFNKEKNAKEKYGGSIFAYMIYNRDGKWLSKDGRVNFVYSELVGKDGSVIADINEMSRNAVNL